MFQFALAFLGSIFLFVGRWLLVEHAEKDRYWAAAVMALARRRSDRF